MAHMIDIDYQFFDLIKKVRNGEAMKIFSRFEYMEAKIKRIEH